MMVYLFHGGVPQPIVSHLIGRPAAAALRENGGFGVQLFFILSGYLIATLLLREEARFGRISLRSFWIRRILRIWPLYYLILVIGFGLIPAFEGQITTPGYRDMLRIHLIPFLAFLGNWSMALVTPLPDWLSILWSVCVEEQFYLIVPLLIALVAPQYRLPLVVALIVASIAVRGYCAHRYGSQLMIVFNTFAQFDTLLSGVLLAFAWAGIATDQGLLRGCAGFNGRFTWLLDGSCASLIWHTVRQWHRTWDYVWVWLCGVGVVMVAVWGRRLAQGRAVVFAGRLAGQDQLRAVHVPRDCYLDAGTNVPVLRGFPTRKSCWRSRPWH